MEEYLAKIGLLLLGILIGLLLKVKVDPILKRSERAEERREEWLQDALDHAEAVLAHIAETRSAIVNNGGLAEPESIGVALVTELTPDFGPRKFEPVRKIKSPELERLLEDVSSAFRAVRMAGMDVEHGAEPASDEYEPTYAVQRYETQLRNFADEVRKKLAG